MKIAGMTSSSSLTWIRSPPSSSAGTASRAACQVSAFAPTDARLATSAAETSAGSAVVITAPIDFSPNRLLTK